MPHHQQREMGRPELFDSVIEESVVVRRDLGWPIVMTPFAQYIVTQATLNVITGERYKQLSDEVVDLLRGDFGPLPGEVDQDLLDRAMSTPRGKLPPSDGTSDETLEQMRKRFGGVDDEELLLRAVMPAEHVDAMQAARSASAASTLWSLLKAVEDRPKVSVAFSNSDVTFELTRPGGTS